MNCKLRSGVTLYFAILLLFYESINSCEYQEINCSENSTSIVLQSERQFSCIQWHGNPDEPCELLLNTKYNKTQPVRLVFESITGELTITNTTEDVSDEEENVMRHEFPEQSSKLEFILVSNFLRIVWTVTDVNVTIVARFQELEFEQHASIQTENSGELNFPSDTNFNHTMNSAYVFILSNETVNRDVFNITGMDVQVEMASLNQDNGDALIIGMGNQSQLLMGPKSLLLTENVTQPLNVHVTGGEAFVILMTGWGNPEGESQFKLKWDRLVIGSVEIPEPPTTPLPDSWTQAVTICISGWTTDEFLRNISRFKKHVSEVALNYAASKTIALVPISESSVQVDREYLFNFTSNNLKGIQLVLTIVQKYDETKASFRSLQLRNMFASPNERTALAEAGFQIVDCESNPDYWDWFWAACITFILCVSLLLVVWYIRYKNFFGRQDKIDTKELIINNRDLGKRQFAECNEYSRGLKFVNDSIVDAEINTDCAEPPTKAFIHRDSVAVANHVELVASKSSGNLKRKTSAPIMKIVSNSADSPRSILKNRSRPLSFQHQRPDTEEIDDIPIYESITLDDPVNEETKL